MKRKEILARAEAVFRQGIQEAIGYVELAKMAQECGADDSSMRRAAIAALQRFSDNDEFIDAMYDAEREIWDDE